LGPVHFLALARLAARAASDMVFLHGIFTVFTVFTVDGSLVVFCSSVMSFAPEQKLAGGVAGFMFGSAGIYVESVG
jgi:hypothetical protein